MIFTLISIILSSLEYIINSVLNKYSNILVIQFNIESKYIGTMSHNTFKNIIVFKKWNAIGIMAKLLEINTERVERLKPLQNVNGALFTYFIATDESKFDHFKNIFQTQITTLENEYQNIYKSPGRHVHGVKFKLTINSIRIEKLENELVTIKMAQKNSANVCSATINGVTAIKSSSPTPHPLTNVSSVSQNSSQLQVSSQLQASQIVLPSQPQSVGAVGSLNSTGDGATRGITAIELENVENDDVNISEIQKGTSNYTVTHGERDHIVYSE